MQGWLDVELAATDALAATGTVPADAAAACRERASFTVEAVKERERTTNHDVAAFVDVVAASVGDEGRWIHYGLTSSDVLDTALALQLVEAGVILIEGATTYRDALVARAHEHAETPCVGRTHGDTRSRPPSGSGSPASRSRQIATSSACGRRSSMRRSASSPAPSAPTPRCRRRSRPPSWTGSASGRRTSTQVVPRDRHAQVLGAVALAGAGLERFAQEVRGLQRTEVREVEEPFASGAQKGSSAMPHKRNPIVSERICGLARVLRGYSQAGVENVALWHERDISHSGAERVILPDATILLGYMQHLRCASWQG